jgi:Ca-activated chloride channel family protein
MSGWASPLWLIALVVLPLLAVLYLWRQRRPRPSVAFPSASGLRPLVGFWGRWGRHLLILLRIAALALLVVALMRPRALFEEQKLSTEGIDLVIALDISTSMLAEDLEPRNRLEAAKQVASEFISGRASDRIGLVMYAGEAFTWAPLTLDYGVVTSLLEQVTSEKVLTGMVEDGTAIGKAIAVGANRLRHGDAESRVLILLTDGVNNVDQPDPLTAAGAAAELGIRIYTIGVGTHGTARAPVMTRGGVRYRTVPVRIDEELLTRIAELSGGRYWRATSTEALREIYARIDQLETTEIEVEHLRHFRERFSLFAAIALALLVLERVLAFTRLRNIAA